MSATPQGVEAQQAMVDITTNNYQKAIEAFFSHYCSYALTIYFQELKAIKAVTPTAEAKLRLIAAGLPVESIAPDGSIAIDFSELATEYWVRCVPGSLTELEDEKQLRILNAMFIPLSQAMPALAATQDTEALKHASAAMQYIVQKQIELSGATHSRDLKNILQGREAGEIATRDDKVARVEQMFLETQADREMEAEAQTTAITQMREQISLLTQTTQALLEKLGVVEPTSAEATPTTSPEPLDNQQQTPTLQSASA
jgi:hypothetical protein